MAHFRVINTQGQQARTINIPNTRITYNTKIGDAAKESGILARVTISTHAYIVHGTIFKHKTNDKDIVLALPARKVAIQGVDRWWSHVRVSKDILDKIRIDARNGFPQQGAWYQHTLDQMTMFDDFTASVSGNTVLMTANADNCFGIKSIEINTNLTDKQIASGAKGRVSIDTIYGTIYGLTLFESKYERQLVMLVPTEVDKNGDREFPAYQFASSLFEASILNSLHNAMTWENIVPTTANKNVHEFMQSDELPPEVEMQYEACGIDTRELPF